MTIAISPISAARPEFTLTDPKLATTWYSFRPSTPKGSPIEGKVLVLHVTLRSRGAYIMPAEEARKLWKRLLKQGFERF